MAIFCFFVAFNLSFHLELFSGVSHEHRQATAADGSAKTFEARVRIDTPQEFEYYNHGGILHYVLRQLAA